MVGCKKCGYVTITSVRNCWQDAGPTSSIWKAFRITFLRTSPSYDSSMVSAILPTAIRWKSTTIAQQWTTVTGYCYPLSDVYSRCVRVADWRCAASKINFFVERKQWQLVTSLPVYKCSNAFSVIEAMELPMMDAFSSLQTSRLDSQSCFFFAPNCFVFRFSLPCESDKSAF